MMLFLTGIVLIAAGWMTEAGGGTPPAVLLVDLQEGKQGLRARPVDPLTLADLPGYPPLDFQHHYVHAFSPDGRTLVDAVQAVGSYVVQWDGRDEQSHEVASGIYLYRLETGDVVAMRRMVVVR